MCSFAVKNRAVQIAFIVLCLVLGAAVQEMLPSFGGAKAPVLALIALHAAFRNDDSTRPGGAAEPSARWLAVACAAGAFEDALNGFPVVCCLLFTLLACTAARFARPFVHELPHPVTGLASAMVAAPLHELWLSVWGVLGSGSSLVIRFFASALPAALVGVLVFTLLPCAERHAGFDGPEPERRPR